MTYKLIKNSLIVLTKPFVRINKQKKAKSQFIFNRSNLINFFNRQNISLTLPFTKILFFRKKQVCYIMYNFTSTINIQF